jgi:hypothetical protein
LRDAIWTKFTCANIFEEKIFICVKTHLCRKVHFFPKIHEINARDEALNYKCIVLCTVLRKSSLTCVYTGKYFVIFKVLCICTICYKKRFCVTTVMFPCEVRVIGSVRRYVIENRNFLRKKGNRVFTSGFHVKQLQKQIPRQKGTI